MTIAELRAELAKYPDDLPVYHLVYDSDGDCEARELDADDLDRRTVSEWDASYLKKQSIDCLVFN